MIDWIVNTVNTLGYLGIALLMFLENVFPPIPSEVIMPLAGFVVIRGDLNFVYVVISGVIGSVLGALPWYFLGRVWGLKRIKKLADSYGKWLTLSSQDIETAKKWFDNRDQKTVCFSRLIPGIRTYISVPAGISKMPLLPFLFYSTLGTILWVSILAYAGYLLGENYEKIKTFLAPISTLIIAGLIIGFVVWVIRRKNQAN
jgi:membrane protein DedA with SNARE-associated domain